MKIQATAAILTYNSAKTLDDCLRPLQDFDEILILDGGSTDGTLEIANKYGARIEKQSDTPGPITDFTEVRVRSFELAKHDWIYRIDSDEFTGEKLVESMKNALENPDEMKAYQAAKYALIDGKVIKYAYFMPDLALRLVNRKHVYWNKGRKVHERLIPDTGIVAETLEGGIVTPWESLEDYKKRDRYYLRLAFDKKLDKRPALWVTVKSVIKNSVQAIRILILAIFLNLRYGHTQAVLPFAYHERFAKYHLAVAWQRIRQFAYAERYQPPSA